MTDPAASAVPPSSAPTSSTHFYSAVGGVTLEAIMEQLQQIHVDFSGRLDTLTCEMCQMNTRVGRIAHRQARMASLAPPPSHSPEASLDDEDDADDDAAISSDDDKMAISQ